MSRERKSRLLFSEIVSHAKGIVFALACAFVVVVISAEAALAQTAAAAVGNWTEKVLHSFGNGDAFTPTVGLISDAAGNLYGTSGAHNGGTVFELSRARHARGETWTERVLHSFAPYPNGDGWYPNGALIFDAAGNLYGVTALGGTATRCGRYEEALKWNRKAVEVNPLDAAAWHNLALNAAYAGRDDESVAANSKSFGTESTTTLVTCDTRRHLLGTISHTGRPG